MTTAGRFAGQGAGSQPSKTATSGWRSGGHCARAAGKDLEFAFIHKRLQSKFGERVGTRREPCDCQWTRCRQADHHAVVEGQLIPRHLQGDFQQLLLRGIEVEGQPLHLARGQRQLTARERQAADLRFDHHSLFSGRTGIERHLHVGLVARVEQGHFLYGENGYAGVERLGQRHGEHTARDLGREGGREAAGRSTGRGRLGGSLRGVGGLPYLRRGLERRDLIRGGQGRGRIILDRAQLQIIQRAQECAAVGGFRLQDLRTPVIGHERDQALTRAYRRAPPASAPSPRRTLCFQFHRAPPSTPSGRAE